MNIRSSPLMEIVGETLDPNLKSCIKLEWFCLLDSLGYFTFLTPKLQIVNVADDTDK